MSRGYLRSVFGHKLLVFHQTLIRISKSVLSQNLMLFSLFQTTCSTAQKASPRRFSASTSPPWKGTQPTSSEQSFELCGCQTQVPRGMNSGLSSTRCVKVPFPCPSTEIKRQSSQSRQHRVNVCLFWNVIVLPDKSRTYLT